MDILFTDKLFLFSGNSRQLLEYLSQAAKEYRTIKELINANLL